MRHVNQMNPVSSSTSSSPTDDVQLKKAMLDHIEVFLSGAFYPAGMKPGAELPADWRDSMDQNIAYLMGLSNPSIAIKRALLLAHPDKNIAPDATMFRVLTSLRENKVPDYLNDLPKPTKPTSKTAKTKDTASAATCGAKSAQGETAQKEESKTTATNRTSGDSYRTFAKEGKQPEEGSFFSRATPPASGPKGISLRNLAKSYRPRRFGN